MVCTVTVLDPIYPQTAVSTHRLEEIFSKTRTGGGQHRSERSVVLNPVLPERYCGCMRQVCVSSSGDSTVRGFFISRKPVSIFVCWW